MPILLSAGKTYGVYIHIPFCKAKCKYCAFVSTPDISCQKDYVAALKNEISSSAAAGAAVDTVYIGGGTPSCLYRGAISDILSAVRKTFSVSSDAEITAEANPESCGDGFVSECADCGVNRVSMGLQSSDDGVLEAVGRLHTYADFMRACERLSRNINNISSDLILGLPGQKRNDIQKSIASMSQFCSHISVYALNVEENTPLYGVYEPDDDAVADMYDIARAELGKSGFYRYEVSNFARNGMMSRHNLKYWTQSPYLGFGVAAHGYDGQRTRYSHTESIKEYIFGAPVNMTELTDKDLYNEYVMLRLRTERGIELADFERRFGCDLFSRAKALGGLIAGGLIVKEGGRVRISPDKMFVMNGIIEELML